ncbi:reverse transcriptase [Plakobranchus ocellatus]|uniref:Reverse transcriptase n=1 Tax=Plakobranchus ocellatus TaxID=259542 RepID=A0AAV4B7H4_9GAST|nr:reverse transcriptase [Plakobranchus ocellatus]
MLTKVFFIPIHKKFREKNQSRKLQPISATSCMCKLIESIIITRLIRILEKNNSLIDEQAGIRQSRSAEDLVTFIVHEIGDGFQDKKHTCTVWVDMSKKRSVRWGEKARYCGC